MKTTLTLLIAAFLFSTAYCQTEKILKDSGITKLSIFLGTWKSQRLDKNDQFAVYTCRWSVNKNYLVCDQLVTDGPDKSNNLAIYAYHASKDSFELSLVGIPGSDPFAIPVTYKGDTPVYSGQYMKDGKTVFNRTTNVFVSPSYYIYKVQSSKYSPNWTTSIEGKAISTGNRLV